MPPDETAASAPPSSDNPSHLLRNRLQDLKAYAHHQPLQAVAAAFGVGLLINLLPARAVAGTVSMLGGALLKPVLISLGITKAIELTCRVSPLTLKP